MSDIHPDAPFLTMCPGCAGNMYAHTDTHGKCDECGQLVTYDRLIEVNEVFLEAQKILKGMMETPINWDTLDYSKMPFLAMVPKND